MSDTFSLRQNDGEDHFTAYTIETDMYGQEHEWVVCAYCRDAMPDKVCPSCHRLGCDRCVVAGLCKECFCGVI